MQRQNIEVAARIRPLSALVSSLNEQKAIRAMPGNTIRVEGGHDYFFDFAVGEEKDQVDLFEAVAKHIVEGCINGYNGTIFAYGQTGSGKTYSMIGPGPLDETMHKCPEKRGLIPRAAELMFLLLHERQGKEGDAFFFEVRCTFVQLYKEKLHDLLRSQGGSGVLEIHLDGHGNTVLVGAEERTLNSVSDLISIVDEGLAKRNVAETAMNTESSRSHAILTLTVKTTSSCANGIVVHKLSRLNLVDLAGSERQKDAMSSGERLKEASAINRSLLMLGRVIRALSDPDYKQGSYVAYRDSTLTYLLKDSLGGNAQTAVIVTLHCNRRFLEESILTLRFAQQVKKVKNRVVANEDFSGQNVDAWKTEIRRLHEELLEANRKFQQAQSRASEERKNALEAYRHEIENHYQHLLDERTQELKELKARYAQCNDSFELLRRYQQAPDAVFEVIDEFKKKNDKQLEFLRNNWKNLSVDDIALSQPVEAGEDVKENRIKKLEMALDDERVAHEITKARFNEFRKRLSSSGTRLSTPGISEQKTPAQIKKERRLTRFTMGTSSYNQPSQRSIFKPVVENGFGNDEESDDMLEDMNTTRWEEERLKLECENNRLVQINEELQEQLFSFEKEKNQALRNFSEKNEQLEETVKQLKAELSHFKTETEGLSHEKEAEFDSLQKKYCNLKIANEKQAIELALLNEENGVLRDKLDKFKELNETIEAELATTRLTTVSENQTVQDGLRLLEMESQLEDLRSQLAHRDDKLKAFEERAANECKRADAAEAELQSQKNLLVEKDRRLQALQVAQEEHDSEVDSKRVMVEELQLQLKNVREQLKKGEESMQEQLVSYVEKYDRLFMEHEALTDAVISLTNTSQRRRSGFVRALDALNAIAEMLKVKEHEAMNLKERVTELENELESVKDSSENVVYPEKLGWGDGNCANEDQCVKKLSEGAYALRSRNNRMEKGPVEKRTRRGKARRVTTRSATTRQQKKDMEDVS